LIDNFFAKDVPIDEKYLLKQFAIRLDRLCLQNRCGKVDLALMKQFCVVFPIAYLSLTNILKLLVSEKWSENTEF